MVELDLLPHQELAYYDTTTKFIAMCGGFRSGKTVTGAYVTARNALLNAQHRVDGAIVGQSAKQVNNVLVKRFLEVMSEWGIPRIDMHDPQPLHTPAYRIDNNAGSIDILNGITEDGLPAVSKIYVFTERSLLQNGLGYELAYFWVDELDTFSPENAARIWEILSTRLSPRNYEVLQGIATSTPEGYRYMYSFFDEQAVERHRSMVAEGGVPDSRIIYASMLDNKHLPQGYINSMLATLPKNKHQAYIHGHFCNIVGLEVYSNYNRYDNNTDIHANTYPNATLYVGMDFNIGHMSSVVHIVYEGNPIAVDEVIEHNGIGIRDVPSMINMLKQKYPRRKIIVYPDPACIQNQHNGGPTTYAQLKDAFGSDGVQAMRSHPLVLDRVNSMNALFGTKKYLVNAATCPMYVRSLERQVYDKTGTPDKANNIDHPLDAAGYFIYTNWPLQGKPTIRVS